MQYTWQLAFEGEARACIFHKTLGLMLYLLQTAIESLDSMKKGRDNYAAREVIKFLEREFKDGHKFIRAQQPEESISPSEKKPSKMEIDIWYDVKQKSSLC